MSSSRLSLADLCQPKDSPQTPTASPAMDSSSTPIHAGTKRPLTIDDQDEDVRIAVRALGDMRSRAVAQAHAPTAEAFAAAAKSHSRASSISQPTPLLTQSSTSSSTSNSSPTSSCPVLELALRRDEVDLTLDPSSKDFVSRVSNLPIVTTALKAYEHSKERSRVVKYGANLMESSVKTISRPVFDRLPVVQLDEFACRQLDRLGYPGVHQNGSSFSAENQLHDPSSSNHTYRDPLPIRSGSPSRAPSLAPSSTDEHSAYGSPSRGPQLPTNPTASNPPLVDTPQSIPEASHREGKEERNTDRQVASRSKWQAVLLEAGGISAAVSEESMKRLQYCLQWLQYATTHIDSQILLLRSFIDSLSPQPPHQSDPHALIPLQTMRSLTDVRRDVVSTIRQVVDVISKYAGGALPDPARATVRSFILHLPARWANANGDAGSGTGNSITSSPPPNPKYYRMAQTQEESSKPAGALPSHTRPTAGRGTHPTAGAATQAAQRILTLATESLDMMRSVTAVFKESLDRAEAWVERLRVVGIQRQGLGTLPPPSAPSASPGPSPGSGIRAFHESDTSGLSPTASPSSSMRSLTSLSLTTQAMTSPPTSIASEARGHTRTCSGEDDAEGETEVEDEGLRRRGSEQDENAKNNVDCHEEIGVGLGMDIDR